MKSHLSEIKRLLQKRYESRKSLINFLISKGIAPFLAKRISDELEGSEQEISHLKEALAHKIQVTGPLDLTEKKVLIFIGPTGVGKSTIIMKLAHYYKKLDHKIAIMSLDCGKKESLKQWAKGEAIPFLNKIHDGDVDLLLIDSEGCNYYLENRIELLGAEIAELGVGAEIVLTLSAAAKDVDLYGAVHQFSPLCPASLTFTKMDETLASGTLINVSAKSDIPIRYIAYGYPLPGDVQVADSKLIAHKVLTDFNDGDFQYLRDLTLSTLN